MSSPYTEHAMSGLPNPTCLEGEIRYVQAQDQQVLLHVVRDGAVLVVLICFCLQRGDAGQICLACSGVEDPDTCHHNITCGANEACPQPTREIIVGKRSEGHHVKCWLCCNETSLCNRDLTCEGFTTPSTPLPMDCSDAVTSSGRSGVYVIYPYQTRSKPVSVYCYVENSIAWTVFQRRINGSVDFYRNWTSYKAGFGHAGGEYWLGNERLHQLTSHGNYELKVLLTDFSNVQKYAHYTKFSIADETQKYKLTITGYSGNAGDSLARHNGQPFSTFDVASHSCAQLYHGAWWYASCHDSNLNGKYLPANDHTYGIGIDWHSWHGWTTSLKTTIMMIKRHK